MRSIHAIQILLFLVMVRTDQAPWCNLFLGGIGLGRYDKRNQCYKAFSQSFHFNSYGFEDQYPINK